MCDEKQKNGHTKGDTLKKVSSFLFLRKAGKSMSDMKSEKEKAEAEEHRDERIEKTGQITLQDHAGEQKIHLLTIIGEVEGHENLAGNSKTTKYEHILPQLAAIEDSEEIGGVLVLLNTMGGDVEAGLAIAEMLASLSNLRYLWSWEAAIP